MQQCWQGVGGSCVLGSAQAGRWMRAWVLRAKSMGWEGQGGRMAGGPLPRRPTFLVLYSEGLSTSSMGRIRLRLRASGAGTYK